MRSIVFLLLMGIVFFIGFSFGTSDKSFFANSTKHNEMEYPQDIIYQANHINSDQDIEDKYEQDKVETVVSAKQSQPLQTTHKIARFFEIVISGFYELVVGVLYEISTLFF